jgi:3-polyprenyl-4-hydroxybenzoate decarboxylase
MLDPSQEIPGLTSRAIIDATRPPHMANILTPSIPVNVIEKVKATIRKSFANL